MTTIQGLPLAGAELAALARELRHRCGSGGSVKGDVVEIQGDHRETVLAELRSQGFTAKAAGG